MFKLLVAAIAITYLSSCHTLTENQQLLANTVADVGVAYVAAQNPEFTPYASAVSDIVRTRGLTPDALDLALDTYVQDNVSEEDSPGVVAVIRVVKASYRRYYDKNNVEVVISNENLQDSLAESLQTPLPNPQPSGPELTPPPLFPQPIPSHPSK